MNERGRSKFVRIDFVDESVFETARQTEQDRHGCDDDNDGPRSRRSTASVKFQRLADCDVTIDSQQHHQPRVDQTYTVRQRMTRVTMSVSNALSSFIMSRDTSGHAVSDQSVAVTHRS